MGGKYYCACGKCGQKVSYSGHYRRECLPAGTKNPKRNTDKQRAEKGLEAKKAAAIANVVIPALTKPQMDNATSKAIFLFDEKFLQFRKQNEGKEVIVVSIAVTAEGLQPSGRNTGNSIMKELEQASLTSSAGMANLVRIVRYKGGTYYENPTTVEQRE